MPTMQSRRRNRSAKRSRWAHCNTPDALRRRRAANDARREALAATLPPVPAEPTPGDLWQTVLVQVYVPTHGRCDQHAALIDGERVGLLSATEIGRRVAAALRKRPSFSERCELRSHQ